MRDPPASIDRRRVLALLGTSVAAGLAGCSGDGDGDGGDGGGDDATTAENGGGGVPSEYETATSLDGTERDPGALSAQADVNYQPEPSDGQQCSGCRYYIEDKNGDGMGACAIVEGTIDPAGWCVSYVAYEG